MLSRLKAGLQQNAAQQEPGKSRASISRLKSNFPPHQGGTGGSPTSLCSGFATTPVRRAASATRRRRGCRHADHPEAAIIGSGRWRRIPSEPRVAKNRVIVPAAATLHAHAS